MHFFTRLTPNFKRWEKPSGRDGKCKSSDSSKALYEQLNGFGWEEWLLEEYFANKENSDFECKGFIEAFNQRNSGINQIDRLYLYTKVGFNKENIKPGCYYVGYINNVRRIDPIAKNSKKIENDLKAAGITKAQFAPMLPYALNISFKVKDVHIDFKKLFTKNLKLERGQYRFGLYNVNKHKYFLKQV